MGDMSQSSSRVKLNRVALKDVVGVKVAPRRRKVPNSRTDTPKEEDSSMLEDSGWNKPPRGVLSHRKTAENGRATSTRQEKRVDNNRTNSPGPAEFESSVRRSNGSFDAVCQEFKHPPLPWRSDSKRGGKRLSSDLVQGQPKSKKTTADGSKETKLWMNPTVVLCDIAKGCSACRHGCGLILPKGLMNKAMRCFKQAVLTGQQFWPGREFLNQQSRRDQTELYGAQVPPEPVCEENQDESFTCQRVSMYTRKVPYSCARTNIPWPFGKGHLSSHGAVASSSLEGGDLSPSNSVTEHPNQAGSPSSFTSGNLDSSHSSQSTPPFPQDEDQIDKSLPGKPLSNENWIHLKSLFLCGFLKAGYMKTDTNQFILPTLLSPVASPHNPDQNSSSSDEEEQTKDQQSSPERHRLQNRTERGFSCSPCPGKAKASLWNDEDEPEGKEDECDEHEQAVGLAGEDASHSKTKSPAESPSSPVQTDTPPRSGEEDLPVLDEITAYEHDILLVDVIQNDLELFVEPPKKSLLRLGPARGSKAPNKTAPAAVRVSFAVGGAPGKMAQSLTSEKKDFCCDGQDAAAESDSRPWRPRCSSTTLPSLQNASPAPDEHSKHVAQCDTNNNHVDSVFKRIQPIQTVSSSLLSAGTDPWIKNALGGSEFRRQKSNSYCRQYFSESLTCGFKMCRFQHLPVEGDEKFCVETVMRFMKNPACLQKAGVVFTGYYTSSPPGVYFSMPLLRSLLWALLKAGMVSDVFSVLRVTLTHNIVPTHEFLLDLFKFVREKSLTGFVPELLKLTFKMASVGLDLSLDCLDCVKNMPLFQQTVAAASPHQKLSPSTPIPDYLNLAHAVVEVELCTKQEDWKRMGKVFCSICQSSYHPNQVESISGRIAIALLSESKDKLSLPFAAFVETVFQSEGEGSLVRIFVGRIGVSLMLRYHKTHQWLKGRAVVEILSLWKVGYTTMKGLFGNEDCASRCRLVTVATELFLLSGSVEGALNTLRENAWFLSSCSWPCDPADLENRARVLKHLAEKTSQRETLEILRNMPDVSKCTSMFNSHLQACVDRQILPVASDTVDFMLSKKLAVDHTLLQTLLHKLGKQNLWLRAREVFRHSLKAGLYPGVSAPPEVMTLVIPCGLGEVEQVLALEMFITVNSSLILHLPDSSPSTLSITLTRSDISESDYLSAGSRLLTAACVPQPKLTVHYTAVNSSQEQVFKLDIPSARRWLRHNHSWASEVWGR